MKKKILLHKLSLLIKFLWNYNFLIRKIQILLNNRHIIRLNKNRLCKIKSIKIYKTVNLHLLITIYVIFKISKWCNCQYIIFRKQLYHKALTQFVSNHLGVWDRDYLTLKTHTNYWTIRNIAIERILPFLNSKSRINKII